MSLLNRYMDDAYHSWMSSALSCCSATDEREKRLSLCPRIEKPMTILHTHQPHLIPSPIAEPQHHQWHRSRSQTLSSRMSLRKSSRSTTESRRPLISAPINFTHVDQGLPQTQTRRGFRPLELSIYVDNKLSPLLPHFEEPEITEPQLAHTRSESALSNFTIRRKPLSRASTLALLERSESAQELLQPLRPRPSQDVLGLQKPLPARLRAYTAPAFRIERVVSALMEKDELDRKLKDIDSVIEERQSVYNMSLSRAGSSFDERDEDARPSSVYHSEEPLPLSFPSPPVSRPTTAPSRPTVNIPKRLKPFSEAVSAFQPSQNTHPLSSHQTMLHPQQNHAPRPEAFTPSPISPPTPYQITPPLPLTLSTPQTQPSRLPLRKKKSFSRVSNWLLRDQHHHAHSISLDSITNLPKPVTTRDGFYSVQIPGRNADVAIRIGYGRQDILSGVGAGGGDSYGRCCHDESASVSLGAFESLVEDDGEDDDEDAETMTTDVSERRSQRGYREARHEHSVRDDMDESEGETGTQTVPTTWTGTPDSSPRQMMAGEVMGTAGLELERTKTFGEREDSVLSFWGREKGEVRVSRVGVAY